MAKTDKWTDAELRAAVRAYLETAASLRSGKQVVKKQVYRKLASRYGRKDKAWEFRFQNISAVLELQGRDWMPGLVPAKNVGRRVAARLEQLLATEEGRAPNSEIAVIVEAQRLQKSKRLLKRLPSGKRKPHSVTAFQTSYVRDASVRAWVLATCSGACENCGSPAPFEDFSGNPFLEVHRVRSLADGGSDTVANAVAVCPNCHRALHHARNRAQLREMLYARISRLIRE